MSYFDEYSENLRFIDSITSRNLLKDVQLHRKTISQPTLQSETKQPDRMGNFVFINFQDLPIGKTLILNLYPSLFKYLRIKCKDHHKPLNFVYESSNPSSTIKIYISRTTDSPNILNHNLSIVNKSKFTFTEQPTHINRFSCDFIYLSIYSDKHSEVKFKCTAGIKQLPAVKLAKPSDVILLEPGAYSRKYQKSRLEEKARSHNSFIISNKESQIKFKSLLEEKFENKKKVQKEKISQVLHRKKVIERDKIFTLQEKEFSSDVQRLASRVNRLKNEIDEHISILDQEWFGMVYVILLATSIRKKYFQKVRRIVVLNRVQVACRKFVRNLKASINYNLKRNLYMNIRVLTKMVGKAIRKSAKVRSQKILSNFMYVYSYQSDGMKKIREFAQKIKYIQYKWRSYKKVEQQYKQKCTFIIQQKWYTVYKQLLIDGLVQNRQAPPQDKGLLIIAITKNLDDYKKQFSYASKLVKGLAAGQASVFRPINQTIMKEIVLYYTKLKK